jgi:hypothetical protein
MALTADEQKLADAANAALPAWFKADPRVQEEVGMMAKQVGAAYAKIKQQVEMTYIGTAVGATSTEPDWLDLLAKDRGTSRQNGETDTELRKRLQTTPVAVVRSELLAAAQAMVTAAGVSGTVEMVELARDAAYLGSYTQATGTGGEFKKSGNTVSFFPAVEFPFPPYFGGLSVAVKSANIVLSGCSSAGNDGTFAVSSLGNDTSDPPTLTSARYTNAGGVEEVDATCTWAIQRIDSWGAIMDGFGKAYVNRGFRCWRGQTDGGVKLAMGGICVILPYGTTEALRLSVLEMLRTKKAAGILALAERRTTP